jgi:hypothetical protein
MAGLGEGSERLLELRIETYGDDPRRGGAHRLSTLLTSKRCGVVTGLSLGGELIDRLLGRELAACGSGVRVVGRLWASSRARAVVLGLSFHCMDHEFFVIEGQDDDLEQSTSGVETESQS